MHTCDVARLVGIRRVLIPPQASTLSAFGMLVAQVKKDYVRTIMLPGSAPSDAIEQPLSDLSSLGQADLAREGIISDHIELFRELDLRYVGQSFELTIPYSSDFAAEFHKAHDLAYGYNDPEIPIEIVNARVRAIGRIDGPASIEAMPQGELPDGALLGDREVTLAPSVSNNVPLYGGARLQPGNRVNGPAIVSYPDTTVFLNLSDVAVMDPYRNLVVEVGD